MAVYGEHLTVEFTDEVPAQYAVTDQPDGQQPRTVGEPVLVETSFRSPRLPRWQFGDADWLKALRLPPTRAQRPRRPGEAVQERLFSYVDDDHRWPLARPTPVRPAAAPGTESGRIARPADARGTPAQLLVGSPWWQPGASARLYRFDSNGRGSIAFHPGGRPNGPTSTRLIVWEVTGNVLTIAYQQVDRPEGEQAHILGYDQATDTLQQSGLAGGGQALFGCRSPQMPTVYQIVCSLR